jgi:DNA-binding transcriptional LysR family regulator
VVKLTAEPMLLGEEDRAPEFNQFVIEVCRSVGFTPTLYRGTVESIRAAVDLVVQGRCLVCVPASCVSATPGTVWRPLSDPPSRYPWSVLWRAGGHTPQVRTVIDAARTLSRELGWLQPPHPPA